MRPFLKLKTFCQYLSQRASFVSLLTIQKYQAGQIASKDVRSTVFNYMFTRKMLYLYRSKDLGMSLAFTPKDTLVIRRFPTLNSSSLSLLKEHLPQINIGDVIVLQDPSDSKSYIIRRLVAVEGHEMVSTNEDDEPFVIEEGQGWIVADKSGLSPEERKDSRTFGPISMSDIVGRVVYRFRNLDDHGFMVNNKLSMTYDMPVLYMELNTEEMLRFTDKGNQTKSS